MTAVTGLRRVTVMSAPATVAPARTAKTKMSARLTLLRSSSMWWPLVRTAKSSGCLAQLGLEVAAELREEPQHRPGRRLAEGADGVAGDADRDVGEQIHVAG